MILECPNCHSKFKVPDGALGANGRRVKCSKCQHVWHANPDDLPMQGKENPLSPTLDTPPPTPAENLAAPTFNREEIGQSNDFGSENSALVSNEIHQMDDLTPPPLPPKNISVETDVKPKFSRKFRSLGLTFGWLALCMVVIAGSIAFFVGRDVIIAQFPATVALYHKVGMGPLPLGSGIALPVPEAARETRGEDNILIITGRLENTQSTTLAIPLLRGSLLNAQNEEIYVWTFRVDKAEILPGEWVSYEAEIVNPAIGTQGLSLTFVTEAEAALIKDGQDLRVRKN